MERHKYIKGLIFLFLFKIEYPIDKISNQVANPAFKNEEITGYEAIE